MNDTKTILKVTVGSRAHGLHNEDSDYDYRGVFVVKTTDILKLGSVKMHTQWIEGEVDDTSWEIGHFLQMAVKCNPTILEVFLAPKNESDEYGERLRGLFPYVWNSTDVYNAFRGYGINQRKKFLEEKDCRPNKYATAYARVLYNAYELLTTGSFNVHVANSEVGEKLKQFKRGDYTAGEVIDFCKLWEDKLVKAYENNPNKQTDLDKVNEFLLEVRKNNW